MPIIGMQKRETTTATQNAQRNAQNSVALIVFVMIAGQGGLSYAELSVCSLLAYVPDALDGRRCAACSVALTMTIANTGRTSSS